MDNGPSFEDGFIFKNNDLSVGYLTLIASGTIFVIGTIYFIKHLNNILGTNCCANFYIFEIFKSYCCIPKNYVWDFMALTDPCCLVTTYTVYTNSDGTVSSTKSCVECWNGFVYLLKRIVMIISTILFYAFFLYIFIVLLIIKILHWIIMKISDSCQKNSSINNQVIQGNIGDYPNSGNVIVGQNPNNAVIIAPPNNDINDINAIENINDIQFNKGINENDINQINYLANETSLRTNDNNNIPNPTVTQEIVPIQITVEQKESANT